MPPRFSAYKVVLTVAMNTDDMRFGKLVGMLKAEEMEVAEEPPKPWMGIAFTVDQGSEMLQIVEYNISLMARNCNKMLKRVEKCQNKTLNQFHRNESQKSGSRVPHGENERTGKKRELQCHEFEGYVHFKFEYPLTKRKSLSFFSAKNSNIP